MGCSCRGGCGKPHHQEWGSPVDQRPTGVEAGPVADDVLTMELVGRRYSSGGHWALRDVSLRVPAGTFVAVMGATGSGKSTLLHCAAGLDRPTGGVVTLAGRNITRM